MIGAPFVRWALGLDVIPPDVSGVEMVWQYSLPNWVWLLCVVGAGTLSWWSYARLVGTRKLRITLGVVRAALIVLLVALVAGPMLRLPIIENERDWVVVLLDRSNSMTIADSPDGSGVLVERDVVLRRIASDPAWELVAKDREIVWLGFDAAASEVDPNALAEPVGWTTDFSQPLETALRRLAGRPASAIVLVSDGKTAQPVESEVLRSAKSRAIPIFTISVGSATAIDDISVAHVEAPRRAFVRDQVPVSVRISCVGGTPHRPVLVELVDTQTGRSIDSVTMTPEEFTATHGETVLTGDGSEEGVVRWMVRVNPIGEDLSKANDEREVEVEFVDRPVRVLYVEGYPRWEYHYLKNLLVRETSLESSVMLLSADREFAQEGNSPIERLPQSAEEFEQYDLFIIGDVPSGSLSKTQITNIATSVSERGAGLLWIGGERSTPSSWRGTELEDLMPINGTPERFDEPVLIEPTPAASKSGVLQLGEDAHDGWPLALTTSGPRATLNWCQRLERESLKPAAEALAFAKTRNSAEVLPVVVAMRYGAGVVLYVATDETWRWRHGVGETYQERFWIQFIRYLARGTVQHGEHPFELVVEPSEPEVGLPTVVSVNIVDSKAGDVAGGAPLEVTAEAIGGKTTTGGDQVQLTRDGNQWVGRWTPTQPGTWRIKIDSPRTGLLERVVEVSRTDTELLHPETDHAQLIDIAARTGGQSFGPGEVGRLVDLIPRRALTREQAILDPIWSSPAALAFVLTLLAIEWFGRRHLRLA